MHHFILSNKDTWISSGSSTITDESFTNQNFGKDQILEVKKFFYNDSFHHQSRGLVQFSGTDFTNMSQSIVNGDITNPKFYLKMYEAKGNSELSDTYTLAIQPISQSWVEGTGKFDDTPKNVIGCSWVNRDNVINGDETAWADSGATVLNVSQSIQSFDKESSDIDVEVTDMVNMWLGGQEENYGMLIRISGSQETDETTFCNLKFFSKNTHTIYPPRLEVRWDDHTSYTGSAGSNTGSLNELTMSGLVNNHLYCERLKESYKENDKVKFRIGSRKKYIQKTFTDSVHISSGSYITEGSGSYAIKDVATDEYIVPFSDYTSISCDTEGMYFNQWLDGFYPDRVYKILLKLKTDDEQEQIFDNDFEFIVRRS
jgi:hypothetical protein